MPRIGIARTALQRRGSDHARRLRALIADDVRAARQDAGLSLRRVARPAEISHATLLGVERGTHDPSTEVLARVAAALGMDLAVRLYPGTGPLVRDHLQAAMIEALLGILHPRWRPTPEVWVTRPMKGVIDLVLEATDASDAPRIAVEAQSELRRMEQQVR
jgi:transcriptional regulator with XRE-family HTH domain